MANPFDQFDAPAGNPFDQFDAAPHEDELTVRMRERVKGEREQGGVGMAADLVGDLLVVGHHGDLTAQQRDGLQEGGGLARASDGFEDARATARLAPVEEVGLLGGGDEEGGVHDCLLC